MRSQASPAPTAAGIGATGDGRRLALVAAISTNERRLHALAVRMLGDHHAAEDAVQEASLRALRALDGFRGDASMATWLYHITSNVCLDEQRRRRVRPVAIDTGDESAPHLQRVDDDFADATASNADLDRALATLPASQRQALLLTDGWGLDYAAAGALLGVAKGTVGSRVFRAKRVLRAALHSSDTSAGEAA